MNFQEIQNAQRLGSNYANDNASFFFEEGMTPDQFAAAALENYNANSDAFCDEPLPETWEVDFKFGAKQSFPA